MKVANFFSLKLTIFFAAVIVTISVPAFSKTHIINFGGISFTPNTLNVAVGDTIVWKGNFGFHELQSTSVPTGAATWGPTTATQTSLVYVVTVPGTYDYQCNTHVSMGMTGTFTAVTAGVQNVVSNSAATLEKSFPNPSASSATIRYTLTHSSDVSLKIFDLSGKEIKQLVNEYQNSGTHEIVFNASALPSGSYTYQLKTGDAILSQQMIIVKQ